MNPSQRSFTDHPCGLSVQTPRIDLLIRILDGDWSSEAQSWITQGLRLAMLEEYPLHPFRAMGLSGTARANRRHIRDFYLAQAAAMLGGDHLALFVKVRRFAGFQWPAWHRCSTPPQNATDLERVLFQAFKADDRMPTTAKQWKSIVRNVST